MKRLDWASLFLMAFSLLIALSCFRIGIGNVRVMGPGFVPLLAAAVLFSLSLVAVVLRARRRPVEEHEKAADRAGSLGRPALLLLALAGYTMFLRSLGYLVATSMLMVFMFVLTDRTRWRKDVLLALLIAVASFVFFGTWLRLQLPAGLLGVWHR